MIDRVTEFEELLARSGHTCKLSKSDGIWFGELRRPGYSISVHQDLLSDVISSLCEALETKLGENP